MHGQTEGSRKQGGLTRVSEGLEALPVLPCLTDPCLKSEAEGRVFSGIILSMLGPLGSWAGSSHPSDGT